MSNSTIFAKTAAAINSVIGVYSQLKLDSRIGDLPGWDSIMTIHLLVKISHEFNIDIPLGSVNDIETVKDLVDAIEHGLHS